MMMDGESKSEWAQESLAVSNGPEFEESFERFSRNLEAKDGDLRWKAIGSDGNGIADGFLTMLRKFGPKIGPNEVMEVVEDGVVEGVNLLETALRRIPESLETDEEFFLLEQLVRLFLELGFATTLFNGAEQEAKLEAKRNTGGDDEEEQISIADMPIAQRTKLYAFHYRTTYSSLFRRKVFQLLSKKLSPFFRGEMGIENQHRRIDKLCVSLSELVENALQSTTTFQQAHSYGKEISCVLSGTVLSLQRQCKQIANGGVKASVSAKHQLSCCLHGAATYLCFHNEEGFAEIMNQEGYNLLDIALELVEQETWIQDSEIFDGLVRLTINGDLLNAQHHDEGHKAHILRRFRDQYVSLFPYKQQFTIYDKLCSSFYRMVHPLRINHTHRTLEFLFLKPCEVKQDELQIELVSDEAQIQLDM